MLQSMQYAVQPDGVLGSLAHRPAPPNSRSPTVLPYIQHKHACLQHPLLN